MPQVLTRRSEPIHPSSQARSPAPTNPKTGSGSDHPGGRSPQSLLNLTLTLSGYCCTLSNCTHRLVSHLTLTGYSCMLNNRTHRLVSRLTLTGYSCMLNNRTHRLSVSLKLGTVACCATAPTASSDSLPVTITSHSRFSAGWPPPLFLHSSPRPKALRSRSSTVASTPRPSRSSFLHALTNSHLSPLAPTPDGAPFSVFYCGFSPAAVALSASSTR